MRYFISVLSISVATLAVTAAPSLAARAAADACAARLPGDAKMIYEASIGGVSPGVNMSDLIKSKTRSLVMSGKLDRGAARPAAEAAATCLKQGL